MSLPSQNGVGEVLRKAAVATESRVRISGTRSETVNASIYSKGEENFASSNESYISLLYCYDHGLPVIFAQKNAI